MTIDNTPLTMAKEDGEADARAREKPMRRAAAHPGSTREYARIGAKLAINEAHEIGMSPEMVTAMKSRMGRWVDYIEAHERDTLALRANGALGGKEKLTLARTMRDARESFYDELFHDYHDLLHDE